MGKRGIGRKRLALIVFVVLLFILSTFNIVSAAKQVLVPVQSINSQTIAKLPAQYYDSIYVCDAQGKPKSQFTDNENVYLCDGRIYETLQEFFARTHNQGYNIETQEFMPKYVNMYQPNSMVDIYVVYDQKLYEDELHSFYVPRSTGTLSESRTVTEVLRVFTVKTDDQGRLPFLSLGKYNLEELIPRRPYGTGVSRTFNYGDTPGNVLSSDPYKNQGFFDVFVDANQDKHYSWTGDLYQSGIVSQGWLKEEPDYFINPITPGFTIKTDPLRLRRNCCLCADGGRDVMNINDVYECDQYCDKLGKETDGWLDGQCPAELLYWRMRKPVVKEEIITFEPQELEFFAVNYLADSTISQIKLVQEMPHKTTIGYNDNKLGLLNRQLKQEDSQIFDIVPDLIDFNVENTLLLLTTDLGELFVIKILRNEQGQIYGDQKYYLYRIWDPKIMATEEQRPFNSNPISAQMLDNGRVILKDATGEDYTLVFETLKEEAVEKAVLDQLEFGVKEYMVADPFTGEKLPEVKIKKLVYSENSGIQQPLLDETGKGFDFIPKMIDYNPKNNLLGILTSLNYIYIIGIDRNEDGKIFGEVVQEIKNIRVKDVQLVGEGNFEGTPASVEVLDDGNAEFIDQTGKRFTLLVEPRTFLDENYPKSRRWWQEPDYKAVLYLGLHPGPAVISAVEEAVKEPVAEGVVEAVVETPPTPTIISELAGNPKQAFTKAFIIFLIIFAIIVCVAIILKEVYGKRY